ncbi:MULTISPECIES: DUF3413 domain-containing protein [Vibrio]|jgi:membrane-anchored protein YejM (alkaline phosphatase superfamily)|uniref:DUF3413 domain-containing protein n=3 Tax=Vibrio harveyi TaxID=669 RepID=A0ABN4KVQ5_VIBHA|nr:MULTISPECIES: DUF3413 domain-containing protein [Vibrio]AMF97067.1 DUF3413 domain-containing protein [Vibrio harveyi]EKO3846771.1 DUF3413 domain-containing protein [Vibrio harveyi]EKO3852422.1 DUF3413 domain-containing protein [Vibrio harveyi]EKO3868031.1 DUF3413 domain-containing protein [Vibrio harveyi]ELE7132839.1 DUF3413 domain-containing protein [Vibrio harveyi]
MVDSGNSYGERVSRLVGWGHWFAFFNIVASMLIGTRYIVQSPWPETLMGQFYLAVSWVGHFGFLVFALYLLVLFPLTFVLPSRKLFRLVAVIFATVGQTVLLIDTQAYQSINLHLNPVVWELLFSEDKSALSSDLQHLFVVMPLIFLVQLALSEWVWRKQRKLSHKHVGRPLAAVFFLSFIASHLVYIWADAYFYNPITSQRSNFPLSYPMTAKSFMEKHGLLDREEYLKRLAENQGNIDLVSYPLEKLEFNRRVNKLNVLMISVNNLRADALNQDEMPNLYQFAQDNQNFVNHYSSSNDTYGAFGLFYGLPSSYASSIKAQGSAPVMLDVLKDQGYSFGLFSGNGFEEDLYSEVIFRGLNLANSLDGSQAHTDPQSISAWNTWLTEQAQQPWFSFIEVTTVDNFESETMAANEELPASERFKQAYEQAVKSADKTVAKIIADLEEKQLLANTIVVITSNHGSEFNETNTNSWGANSNYSKYQLQVPMVIHWPGMLPAEFTHSTSHLDLSVTLLQDMLGVSSNPYDYSSGRNLFDESRRRWILAGDTREIALITGSQTTVIDKFGNYKLYDDNYKRLRETSPKLPVLMQGLTELQRFYSKSN